MLGGMGEGGRKKRQKQLLENKAENTYTYCDFLPHKKCIFLGEVAQVLFEIQRGISPSKNIKEGGHCLSLCESKQDTKVSPVRNANMGCEEEVKHQVQKKNLEISPTFPPPPLSQRGRHITYCAHQQHRLNREGASAFVLLPFPTFSTFWSGFQRAFQPSCIHGDSHELTHFFGSLYSSF